MSTNGHHLILGKVTDFISGGSIDDTHDERYRQHLAQLLVEKKGFAKDEITPQKEIYACADENKAIIRLDFYIMLANRIRMIIKYGPGSLVTRHRPALAIARLLALYQIPLVVVTNGEDADILAGKSGKVLVSGLARIPSRRELLLQTTDSKYEPISPKQVEIESRILYAYEVDGSCPCDETICRL
jgi:hypothetical protein